MYLRGANRWRDAVDPFGKALYFIKTGLIADLVPRLREAAIGVAFPAVDESRGSEGVVVILLLESGWVKRLMAPRDAKAAILRSKTTASEKAFLMNSNRFIKAYRVHEGEVGANNI